MRSSFVSFLVGILFALGLGVSGMTQPEKVIGFLNLFNGWDPSLAFVMIGAIGIHAGAFFVIKKRTSPILADQFQIPTRTDLHPKLFIGATLFGMGWGLAGYCPGPAITSLPSLQNESLIFVGAMLIGMLIFKVVGHKLP